MDTKLMVCVDDSEVIPGQEVRLTKGWLYRVATCTLDPAVYIVLDPNPGTEGGETVRRFKDRFKQ